MLKKRWKFSFFNVVATSYFLLLTFYLYGCAPKVAPPPLYKNIELSLKQVIQIVSRDVDVLKAVVGINIEKNNEHYSFIDASVLLKRPGLAHLRMYKFGILVGDIIVKDSVVHLLSGKSGGKFKEFGKELYPTVLWWDALRNGYMHKKGAEYIIRVENKKIHLDSATLLPVKQEIRTGSKDIYIMYDKPRNVGSFWYPSEMEIKMGDYKFTVKIEKLFINPPLGENDFKIPAKS